MHVTAMNYPHQHLHLHTTPTPTPTPAPTPTHKHVNVPNKLRNPTLKNVSGARKPPRMPPELPEPKKQSKTTSNKHWNIFKTMKNMKISDLLFFFLCNLQFLGSSYQRVILLLVDLNSVEDIRTPKQFLIELWDS